MSDGPQELYRSLGRTEKFVWIKRSGKGVCTGLGFKGLHGQTTKAVGWGSKVVRAGLYPSQACWGSGKVPGS